MAKPKTETQNSPISHLVSVSFLAANLSRPMPWVAVRLDEMSATPELRLDSVDYFSSDWLDSLTRVSQEWTERVRVAKLESAKSVA